MGLIGYRPRPVPHYDDNDFGLAIAGRYMGFAAQAVQLLGAVAAEPPRGVPLAESMGVCLDVFDDSTFADLALIWGVFSVGRDQPADVLKGTMQRGLKAAGCWDEKQLAANLLTGDSMHWPKAGLDALFDSYPSGTAAVPHNARRTLVLRDRLRQAETECHQLLRTLCDDPDPDQTMVAPLAAAPTSGGRSVVFSPVRFARTRRARSRRHAV